MKQGTLNVKEVMQNSNPQYIAAEGLEGLPHKNRKARVVYKNRGHYKVICEGVFSNATITGKWLNDALDENDLPCVGDEVHLDHQGVILEILPRKSTLSRKLESAIRHDNGAVSQAQILATNIDKVLILTGMDSNFNIKRIERFLTLVYQSGALPILILSKLDLCDRPALMIAEAEAIAFGIPVIPFSAVTGEGIDAIRETLTPSDTIVLVGSSGVGKSTLTNLLLEEALQLTGGTQGGTGKGRHTTTASQMLFGTSGLTIIDTPGIRAVQLWADEESLDEAFNDVGTLGEQCRFADCTHRREPGCAVLSAIKAGTLTQERLNSYHKLQKELIFLEHKKATVQKKQSKASQTTKGKPEKHRSKFDQD